tara:strand:+ start:753 stop:1085 length:333 start_codon:yes stop_codon:yes gene_type:complete
MSRVDFKITPKMVNAYQLHKTITGSRIENLHKIWSKEIGTKLDKTQIKWITDCMTGKRSMNIYSRHGNQFITHQAVMLPEHTYAKDIKSTLYDISEEETKSMTKSLKSWL